MIVKMVYGQILWSEKDITKQKLQSEMLVVKLILGKAKKRLRTPEENKITYILSTEGPTAYFGRFDTQLVVEQKNRALLRWALPLLFKGKPN